MWRVQDRLECLPVSPWVLWSRVVWLAVLSTINLWTGNAAFLYIDAGFITMLKVPQLIYIYNIQICINYILIIIYIFPIRLSFHPRS